jgi:hypothetical protein
MDERRRPLRNEGWLNVKYAEGQIPRHWVREDPTGRPRCTWASEKAKT